MGQEQSPNQAGVYAVSIILLVFSTIAVALRFKVRRMKQTGYGADDWLILAALVRGYKIYAVENLSLHNIASSMVSSRYSDFWYVCHFCVGLTDIDIRQGASQGSVGTHTAVDPETGKALETWQDLQIAEASH